MTTTYTGADALSVARDRHHADRAADQRHQGDDLLQLRQHQQRRVEHRRHVRRRLLAGHRRRRHPEQGPDGPGAAAARGQAVRRDDQEDVDRHGLRRQPDLARRPVRRQLPRQLRPDLRRRRPEADHRASATSTCFGRKYAMRIWLDPDRMANMRIAPDRGRSRRSSRRTVQAAAGKIGGRPVPAGPGVRVPITVKGRLEKVERVRGDHRPPQRRRLDRPPQGRRPRRARLGELRDGRLLDGKPAGAHPDLPVRRRQRPGHRRAGPRARWTGSRRASRRASTTRSPTTRPSTSDENINEVEHTLIEAFVLVHDRRVRLPPGVPGHDHPDAGDPGLAGRHVRGDGGLRLLDQHADAVRAGPGDRPGGRRRDHRRRERREVPRARAARRWRRPGRRWPRSRRRS